LKRLNAWRRPALVLAIDLLWSLLLEQIGQPLFVGLFPGQTSEAKRLLDTQLIPTLWFSYGIVMAAQIGWLTWAAQQTRHWQDNVSIAVQIRRLRQVWWWCAIGQLAISIALQLSLIRTLGGSVDPAGLGLVLGLLVCDLLVIYWLPTTLLISAEHRAAIPGTRRFQSVPDNQVRRR